MEMENEKSLIEETLCVEETPVLRQKKEMVKKLGESSKTVAKEVVDSDKLSELKHVERTSVSQVMKAFIKCKVKFDAKSTTLEMFLNEVKNNDCQIRHQLDELTRTVGNMNEQTNLQNMQIQMTAEDILTTAKLLDGHKKDIERAETSLSNAIATKATIDEKLQSITNEEILIKQQHAEKVQKLTDEINEYKNKIQEDVQKRKADLESDRSVLLETKRIYEELINKKKSLEELLESKRKQLEHTAIKLSSSDVEIEDELKMKEKLMERKNCLGISHDLLLSETKASEDVLCNSQKSYEDFKIKHQEVKNELETLKNKNASLSEDVKTNINKLELAKVNNQEAYRECEKEISQLQQQHQKLKDELNQIKSDSGRFLEDAQRKNDLLTELQNEYHSKKLLHDELKARDQTDTAVLDFAQREFQEYREKLEKTILEKAKLQEKFENLSQTYENKKDRIINFNKDKKELELKNEAIRKSIVEKIKFYEDSKNAQLTDLERFKLNQESIIKSQELVLREKKYESEKLELAIKSVKEMISVKREQADDVYNNYVMIQSEVQELENKVANLKKDPNSFRTINAPSTSTGLAFKQSALQKGILRGSEAQLNSFTKKVTFDPALAESECSEGSVQRMFEEIFGKAVVAKEKPVSSEELFDNMLRSSPPVKDKK